MAVVALAIVGFCIVDVNELGPLHEYVLPPLDDKLIVEPTHSVSPVAVAVGIALIVATALLRVALTHPLTVQSTK